MITISFFLILQKAVCPYEYMDDLKKLNEASLAETNLFTVTQLSKILLIYIISTDKKSL